MKECLDYKRIDRSKVHCQTCSHFCEIDDGKTGVCGIRQNIRGRLFLLTYGKVISMQIDPIEKKPLFHFLPGSLALSFGTLGCNFRCANCQNFDISQIDGKKGLVAEYGNLNWGQSFSPEQIMAAALENGCQSIAYTYNEPTIFLEYALDTMKLAQKNGIRNVWVSNGYMSEQTIKRVAPYLDGINVDIKSFDDDFYKTNCGASVFPVLNNCQRLVKEGIWLEITTLIIPGLSDDEKMLRKIADFINTELGEWVPWHLSAFSPEISWKLKDFQNTPFEKVAKAYMIGKSSGLKNVYVGNVGENEMENTICPSCGEIVIRRSGYKISDLLVDNKCAHCKSAIRGYFK